MATDDHPRLVLVADVALPGDDVPLAGSVALRSIVACDLEAATASAATKAIRALIAPSGTSMGRRLVAGPTERVP